MKVGRWQRTAVSLWATGVLLAFMAVSGPCSAGDFDQFIRPVSNPVYFSDARNQTTIHPIYLYQDLPSKVDTIVGKVPVDGHVNGFALAATYAFSPRFSLVAQKDGYIDIEADHTLSDSNGWANIAAGAQYAFIYDTAHDFILTGRLIYELPSGSDQVYQGNGSGNFAPSVLFMKGFGALELSGTLGFVLPVDNDKENTLLFHSWHLSYAVTKWLHPLVELNQFYVLKSGDRDVPSGGLSSLGTHREDDLVAGIATFNGADIINLGGKHSDEHRNLVTMALGGRIRATDWLDFGAVYEFPLTKEEYSLIDDRFLVDAVVTLRF